MRFSYGIFRTLLLALVLCAFSLTVSAQDAGQFSIDTSPLPQATEPVNDFAGVLSPQTIADLNKTIKDFKARTNPSVVLAVAIVRTTGEREIFEYSLAVARGWKVGTDKDDNPSALLFIAIDDRKYFTQVSRNLEDELPDGLAGQLQRRNLVPAFKQGDYDKGVRDTIEAYISTIEGKVGRAENRTSKSDSPRKSDDTLVGRTSLSSICGCIILFLIFLTFFSGRRRSGIFFFGGTGGWGGGGDWSSGGGGGDWGGFSGGDFGGGGAGGDW